MWIVFDDVIGILVMIGVNGFIGFEFCDVEVWYCIYVDVVLDGCEVVLCSL